MHKYLDQYLPAPASRVEDAEKIFPYKEISAEEYAAREGHRWASFSFGEYIYPDEKLNEWIHTLDDIFFTPGCLDKVRRKYLTEEEIEVIKEEESEI